MKKDNALRLQQLAGIANKASINELFGLSKAEKESAALKSNIEKAKKEIDNASYSLTNLFFQPGSNTADKESLINVKHRLQALATAIPTAAALLPKLFDTQTCGLSTIIHPNGYKGLIASCIGYYFQNQDSVMDIEIGKTKLKNELDRLG